VNAEQWGYVGVACCLLLIAVITGWNVYARTWS
jgi:hypothetical protein